MDRDAKTPEVYVLEAGAYRQQSSDASGWVTSPATGIEMRAEPGRKLGIRLARQPETLGLLPED